jgi:predicted metal-dependent hydrolase
MESPPSVRFVTIKDSIYKVLYFEKKAKRARSTLKTSNELHIKIPLHWKGSIKTKVYLELLEKSIRSIEKGRWSSPINSRYSFFDGQRIAILGNDHMISIRYSSDQKRPAFGDLGTILDFVFPNDFDQSRISKFIDEKIEGKFLPLLSERINSLNFNLGFKKQISQLIIRNNRSTWGSCSKRGTITINFKLFFVPLKILDYVIIHELSHFDHPHHGKSFWNCVKNACPDYEDASLWLKKESSTYLSSVFSRQT